MSTSSKYIKSVLLFTEEIVDFYTNSSAPTNGTITTFVELIKAFGFEHYFAPHEADQLCVYLTTSGITYATLSSSQRFMGLESNDSEVRRYGSMTKEQVDEYNKISGSIGAELIGKHKLSK
jgi:hypothetical protein